MFMKCLTELTVNALTNMNLPWATYCNCIC